MLARAMLVRLGLVAWAMGTATAADSVAAVSGCNSSSPDVSFLHGGRAAAAADHMTGPEVGCGCYMLQLLLETPTPPPLSCEIYGLRGKKYLHILAQLGD